ncbi:MAG: PilZ domain-containing protein [Nitrososphaera sp.]|nr:PilZ domain-containing protein [Nitrososphaera sp.]
MKQPERRRDARVNEKVSVTLIETGQAFSTETKNLSTSGAYCRLERFIPPMTKLQLEYDLPNGGKPVRIRCSGVVVRVEPVIIDLDQARYDVAIFFTDLTDRDRSAIAQFVHQRLSTTA